MWADWPRRPVITLARTCCCFISLTLLLRNNDVIELTKGRVDPTPFPPVVCFLLLDDVHLDLQEPPQNLESSICNHDEKWTFRFWTHLRLSPRPPRLHGDLLGLQLEAWQVRPGPRSRQNAADQPAGGSAATAWKEFCTVATTAAVAVVVFSADPESASPPVARLPERNGRDDWKITQVPSFV